MQMPQINLDVDSVIISQIYKRIISAGSSALNRVYHAMRFIKMRFRA